MAFDKHSDLPLVQPRKKTTKVNIAMVLGILLFFLAGALAVRWFVHHQ